MRGQAKGRERMENSQIFPSTNAILTGARSMPIAELERLVNQLIAIRTERVAPHLTAEEGGLLTCINQGLPTTDRYRLRELLGRKDDGSITDIEWQELTALTDRLDLIQADQLTALTELGQLRGITLDEVMTQLGIQFPNYD